jgi:hypothetical protein
MLWISRVRHGRFVLLPISAETRGHGTHTLAEQWQNHLRELLATRVDVRLPRGAHGRTSLDDGLTVRLPPGWLADTNVEGIHEYRIVLRPPNGEDDLTVVLSGAIYSSDPPKPAAAATECVNGLRGWREDFPNGRTFLSLMLGRARRDHYADFSFAKGGVAERIARTFELKGRAKGC